MRKLVISAVAVVAAAASFACGDGGKKAGDDGDGTPRATIAAGTRTPSGGTPPGGTPPARTPAGGGDTENGGGADRDHVRRTIEKFIDSTFTGEYQATGPDDDDGLRGGTITIYKDGKTSLRFDIRTQQDGEDVEMIFITAPGVTAFCMSGGAALGIPVSDGTCFDDDPTGGFALGDLSSELEALETQDFDPLEDSEREIAGIGATCFRAKDADGEESDICLSDNGELLQVGGGSDGTLMTATSISSGVDADAFTLPYDLGDPLAGE